MLDIKQIYENLLPLAWLLTLQLAGHEEYVLREWKLTWAKILGILDIKQMKAKASNFLWAKEECAVVYVCQI